MYDFLLVQQGFYYAKRYDLYDIIFDPSMTTKNPGLHFLVVKQESNMM